MLLLESFLPYRLSVLSNQISRGIAATYEKPFGLTVTEWRVIAILGRFPGITAAEVAQRSAMDKVAISRTVKRLMEQGHVERHDSDSDRRSKHLWLSREGRRVYRAIVPAALEFERRLLAGLTSSERKRMERLLDKLDAAAERLLEHGERVPEP